MRGEGKGGSGYGYRMHVFGADDREMGMSTASRISTLSYEDDQEDQITQRKQETHDNIPYKCLSVRIPLIRETNFLRESRDRGVLSFGSGSIRWWSRSRQKLVRADKFVLGDDG